MRSGAYLWAIVPAVVLAVPAAAMTPRPLGQPGAIVVPAVSSNAHRSDGAGNYGAYKGRPPAPLSAPRAGSRGLKQPYPYRYYSDTNRSISGCRWMAKRAIDTDSRTWWARYRACRD